MSHITKLLDELLEHCTPYSGHHERYHIALRHLRAALAQPEPVPQHFDEQDVLDLVRQKAAKGGAV